MNRALSREFRNPGSEYRGAPFWAWNGRLDPEELRRQVRVMRDMGLGGFFMHSRVGLDTAYLSDEWFECVEACVDEAEKLDMQAWLYDEDRWPSGAAGGLVTKDPKYRARVLVMKQISKPSQFKWSADSVAAFRAVVKGSSVFEVRRIGKGRKVSRLRKGESILHFHVKLNECSSWFNGYTYLDTMNHEAVKRFINVTHEAYRKRLGRKLGRRVPGIFTDEPNHGSYNVTGNGRTLSVPWTDKLPRVFRKRYGYDLIARLPGVFLDVDGEPVNRTRYHYHDCTTHLFVDAFARQIGDWCDRNGMQHTGHVLEEDSLSSQTTEVGSCMRFYEYMQAPGMDLLTEHCRVYDTAKQVSSAARQFGRKWRLTETYGCTGWDFPFLGHKALGDWQAALGINLRCQHLSWYTMEGEAKRDYPASIFYQSPWWEHYSKVEDYFARINLMMTRGEEVRDLLVVHPVESMWVTMKKGASRSGAVGELNDSIAELRDTFLHANIDFDYGDEEILARHGKTMKKAGVPVLKVGKAEYRAVVVPPLVTVRATTLELLERFRRAGGAVVFAGEAPDYVDGSRSRAAREFAAGCPTARTRGGKLISEVEDAARRVSITDADGKEIPQTLYLLREDGEAFYLFVCNTGNTGRNVRSGIFEEPMARDRKAAFSDVSITGFAGCSGSPIEFNADSGEAFGALAKRSGGNWKIKTSLPALSSRLYVIPKKKGSWKAAVRRPLKKVRSSALGGKRWNIGLSESNNLVLDRPKYRVDGGPWQGPEEILRLDRAVRRHMDFPFRGGHMVQPWARQRTKHPKTAPLSLEYRFEVKSVPGGEVFLALEQPGTFVVSINGQKINTDAECGWWCDRSLRRIPVDPSSLRVGVNKLTLECDYHEDHPGLEVVYLLGSFGVEVHGTEVCVTRAPESLRIGDWVKQGLPFYSGNVSYCRTIRPRLKRGERLFVEVPSYRGVGVRVLVDGVSAGITAWEPNEVEITDLVGSGAAELRIEVLGHRRNSHGPFHIDEKWPFWTGPASYQVEEWDECKFFDGYQLVPFGLMAAPRLTTRAGS